MTAQTIIDRAKDIADIAGSSFFSSTETYASLNESYRDIYEAILNSNDDYFAKDWSFIFSGLTQIANEPMGFTIDLVTDFYRFRALQYEKNGSWFTVHKFTIQDENRAGRDATYRIQGTKLKLILPLRNTYTNFRALYFPVPTVYATGTDAITFPPQLEPAILSYQIAIDIKRKQCADYSFIQQRRDELMQRFLNAIQKRDDAEYERLNNVYSVNDGWVR